MTVFYADRPGLASGEIHVIAEDDPAGAGGIALP
jgi:hypothetical protein